MSKLLTSIGEFFAFWRFTRVVFVVVALLVAIGAWKLFFSKNGDAENYVTAIVERGEIQNLVTATGVLQPREYVDVGAQVSGQLRKLNVVVGQQVTAGDLLAEIDATVFRAKVDGIRAQLQNQQAQLGDRQAQLALAKIRIDRQQNLFKDDATTKESVQVAEASFQSAGAQLKALQAQIQQTESSLRAEEANLAYARIYAPMSGTVVSITSRQGQTLNANNQAPTIMRIADLSTMTIQTQVSEADIGKLHVGMPVYFTTLGGQDYRWYSKLNRVEPTPQVTSNVVLYNALFDVPNENGVLMTSMSTQVFFIAAQARDTLVIPASALNFKVRKPGETDADENSWGDKKPKDAALKKDETLKNNEESKKESSSASAEKPATTEGATSSAVTEVADAKSKPSERGARGERDSNAARGQASANGEEPWARKRGQRRAPPSATDEVKPQPATVQVMDEKGNLTERNIMVGISSRVRVQVLDGLQEGEKIVSGMRQTEKANSSSQGAAPGAPGMGGPGGGGVRQMR
jgi:macrolide-specific efflux system membrane fusion protein